MVECPLRDVCKCYTEENLLTCPVDQEVNIKSDQATSNVIIFACNALFYYKHAEKHGTKLATDGPFIFTANSSKGIIHFTGDKVVNVIPPQTSE